MVCPCSGADSNRRKVAAKPRVHEVAAELGIDSKVALDKLKEMGEYVKGPSSSIEPPVARRLKAALEAAGIKPAAAPAPVAKAATPRPAAAVPAPVAVAEQEHYSDEAHRAPATIRSPATRGCSAQAPQPPAPFLAPAHLVRAERARAHAPAASDS